MGPAYQTDYQLAKYPIIVVARWNRAEMTRHDLVEGNVLEESEVFTELEVERVIRGDLKPGRHKVRYGWGIGWLDDGTGLATWTSTHIPGDVDDVTKPNLWFLGRQRSWDKTDPTEYLHVPHYRAIQPLVLEPYFEAVASPDRDREVPRLLYSREPLIVRRALGYVCGYVWPWPYEPPCWDLYGHSEKRERLLVDAASDVEGVIAGNLEEVRPLAVAVYAELTKSGSSVRLGGLLADENPAVRGVALGLLVRQNDASQLGAMINAAAGVRDAEIACKIADVLLAWGEPRTAPILINFLDNDEFAYRYGDDLGIPAIKARTTLHKLTGRWFPFDVAAASEAWSKTECIAEPEQRQRHLAELLPDPEFPVLAELVGKPRTPLAATTPTSRPASAPTVSASITAGPFEHEDGDVLATLRVRNVAGHPVTLAGIPSSIEQDWLAGGCSRGLGPRRGEQTSADYVTLDPNEHLELEVSLDGSFLLAEPESRKLTLMYTEFGPIRGPSAWIGALPVRFGALWNEERKLEQVEERWPNGNLRAVGKTVNGKRFGEWQFFNEEGDRIRVVHYTGAQGDAECDPDHPDNKGAGRRPAQTSQQVEGRPRVP
jgi:hypothetical protein